MTLAQKFSKESVQVIKSNPDSSPNTINYLVQVNVFLYWKNVKCEKNVILNFVELLFDCPIQ